MEALEPILLIDNEPANVMAVRKSIDEMRILNSLVHTIKVDDALEYLSDLSNLRPCLILINLDKQVKAAQKFLKIRKENSTLKDVPVLIMVETLRQSDEYSDLLVSGYIIKLFDYLKLVEALKSTSLRWMLTRLENAANG